MTVLLKPRNRLVNFRLTEEEYGKLAALCVQRGSPSISECARAAILRLVEREAGRGGPLDGRLEDLDGRVAQLEALLRGLAPAAPGPLRTRRRAEGGELEQK